MQSPQRLTVAILVTSDIHGNVLPYDFHSLAPNNKGFAKMATLLKTMCKTYPHHLLIDNGDLIQGSPLTYYSARIDSSSPHPLIACLNTLKYDAAVIGNHEFNYGQDLLRKVMGESTFPWLCANICHIGTDIPAFGTPYIVKSFPGNCKVGVLGLTTNHIPFWESEQNIDQLSFLDPVEVGKKWVRFLREEEGVDIVVISYHGGIERDIHTGEPTEKQTGENQGYQICMEIKHLDVLITGHQHRNLTGSINGVAVVQPESEGRNIGLVTLSLEKRGENWFVRDKDTTLVTDENIQPDSEIMQLIHPYEKKTQDWLNQPIGHVDGDMSIKNPMVARLRDNPLIEFINQVQMHYGKTSISCTPLFDDDCPGFKQMVTMREIMANYKYSNTLRVLRVKGSFIKEALEISASFFVLNDQNEVCINPSFSFPKPQYYNYDMWEGIDYILDISRPIGDRVISLNHGSSPLNPDLDYEVAMNNYRAAGGGDYTLFRHSTVVRDIFVDVSELIADYFLEYGTVVAQCNHNWHVVTPKPISDNAHLL